MAKDEKVGLISSVPMFCRLGKREQEQVAQLLTEVDVPAGRVLMRQGETGHEMFIVVSGGFRVERDGKTINDAGPGAVLGEMSLIAKGPRTATVTATSPSTLLVASQAEFNDLMQGHPGIRLQVLEGLATKVRNIESNQAH
jgi:CRP-like cAMP-binding protein